MLLNRSKRGKKGVVEIEFMDKPTIRHYIIRIT